MRLITRSDFDGLVCAVLLREVEQIDAIDFVHPKDVQDGKVLVTGNDIVTNLPYVPGVGLWFDHHSSEESRVDTSGKFKGRFEVAPSAARVVYNYYASNGKAGKLERFERLLDAVDRSDSAQLTVDEVTRPSGWILLSYVMDPRTGLAYHHNYRISNRDLMLKLVDWIGDKEVDEIIEQPDIKERIHRYNQHQLQFERVMSESSRVEENAIITDLRGKDIPAGNRFLIYTMYPSANIQVRIFDGKKGEFIVVAVGHSIFNRTSKTDVGKLMGKYGGGGHKGAGTCQLPLKDGEEKIREIIATIKKDG